MFASGMTNSALLNLTKSLSTEFGEDNVLVNAICPGWVATDLWVRNTEGLKKELNVTTEEEARKLAAKKNSPMPRRSSARNAPVTSPAFRSTSTAAG
jgi:3-oxoacyl-[acyl-carrier protein] reductase